MTGTATQIIRFLTESKQMQNTDKVWDLKEHKERRSLDSNAYFHVLADKLRQVMGWSMAYCKNHLIGSYGQIQYLPDGAQMIYKTNAPEEYMMELETIHTVCVKVDEERGKKVFFYRIYRGSHEYNSAEMAKLIDGTVNECEAQGIETATPDELARMAALWERKYEKRTNKV